MGTLTTTHTRLVVVVWRVWFFNRLHPAAAAGNRVQATDMRPRVLYIYGLECGPNGTKARFISDHFNTAIVEHSSTKLTTTLRHISPTMIAVVTMLLLVLSVLLEAAIHADQPALKTTLACGTAAWAVFTLWLGFVGLGRLWMLALQDDLDMIRQKIRAFGPDVLVGSSYGGALASLSMLHGDWKGPTVLLAPATATLARVFGVDFSSCTWPEASRVLIVHSEEDTLVPFRDGLWLHARIPKARFIPVTNDNHRLDTLLDLDQRFNLRALIKCAHEVEAEIPTGLPDGATKQLQQGPRRRAKCFGRCVGYLAGCFQTFRGPYCRKEYCI